MLKSPGPIILFVATQLAFAPSARAESTGDKAVGQAAADDQQATDIIITAAPRSTGLIASQLGDPRTCGVTASFRF